MKATLEFTLPEDTYEFHQASNAGQAFSAIEEFSSYLRGQEKHVEPAERDDLAAVRRMWFEIMGDLLE
jgi:hypothetical protein